MHPAAPAPQMIARIGPTPTAKAGRAPRVVSKRAENHANQVWGRGPKRQSVHTVCELRHFLFFCAEPRFFPVEPQSVHCDRVGGCKPFADVLRQGQGASCVSSTLPSALRPSLSSRLGAQPFWAVFMACRALSTR